MRKVYLCQACKSIQYKEDEDGMFCSHCGGRMSFSGYPEDAWERLTEEEKQSIISEHLNAYHDVTRTQPAQQAQTYQNADVDNRRKMKCPRCKSRNLTISVEQGNSSSDGILAYLIGGPLAACAVSSQNTKRTYWKCLDCGESFLDMKDLKDRIDRNNKVAGTLIILLVVWALLDIFISSPGSPDDFFLSLIIGAIMLGIIVGAAILVANRKKRKLSEEYERIKRAYEEE